MIKTAINRPISVLMLFLGLFVFGIISIFTMPINLYPNVNIPLIKITTIANADLNYMESMVTKRIENQISGVSQIKKIVSKTYNNISIIMVEFELGKDLEIAANDIRAKISKIHLAAAPSIEKISSNSGSVLNLFISSDKISDYELMNFINDDLVDEFQKIKGVGEVKLTGFLKNDIKIELDINKVNKYHLNTLDIAKLIKMQNFKSYLGEANTSEKNVSIKGYFDADSIEELKHLRLAPGVFLQDVAKISRSNIKNDNFAYYKGTNGVLLELKKIEDFNTLTLIKNIKNELENIKTQYKYINFDIVFDKSANITKHIYQVVFDMFFGVILTVLIVFLFLRNVSATIIASIAIPTSIISCFFLIKLFGYDLNRLTLIALTLSIGIFVDDAIVVIENINKKIAEEKDALMASFKGVKEIAFSVLSISVVLLCVFVPISFMNSIPGLFFNTLGMSVAFGVIISFFVCVFLVPTISARFLSTKESAFYHKSEHFFVALEENYSKLLEEILNNKKKFIFLIIILCLAAFSLAPKVGLNFLPMEDDSELQIKIESRKNLSMEQMQIESKKIFEQVKADENVEYAYLLIGYDDAHDIKQAKIYVKLKNLEERNLRQPAVVEKLRASIKAPNFRIKVLEIPKFEGAGVDDPVQFVLKGNDYSQLKIAAKGAKEVLSELDGIVDLADDEDALNDVFAVKINSEKARKLGINTLELAQVIQSAFADISVGLMDTQNDTDTIFLSLNAEQKSDISSLEKLQIRSASGAMISLVNIAKIEQIQDVSSINRFDKSRSIKITSGVAKISLDKVRKQLESNLDRINAGLNVNYAFTGFISLLKETITGFVSVLLIAFLLIYLVLAALYESLIVPIIIMLTMPLAFAGTCVGLYLSGNQFSLFVLIAIILLFGMVGKNAILLIDVANRLCDEGVAVKDALISAGKQRIRAILMTTIAMIFAMLPLAISQGSGYEANSPMAIAVISGLISSTILTLFVIPAIYGACYKIDRKLKSIYQRPKID